MNKFFLSLVALFVLLGQTGFAQTDSNVFYDVDHIPEIRITFPVNDWASQLDSLRVMGDGLLFGSLTIDGKSYKNIGVRYRGSKSFTTGGMRNALHIKLNYIKKNQNHQGNKSIKLSNSLRDPSMIREVLGYEIARKYMPAPQANYARVFINNELYGLFVNVEDIKGKFLKDSFGSSKNTLVKCSPGKKMNGAMGCKKNVYASLEYEENAYCFFQNYELKSDGGWDDLIELADVLKNDPTNVEKILNIDRTLWMLAYNNVLVNLSSYSGGNSQNYYLYKDDKGQFNPIIWDLNLAFGSFKNIGTGSDLGLRELQNLDPLLHKDNPTKPLISQLLKNPDYEKIYLAHMHQIIYDNFVEGQYEKRAEQLQRLISRDLTRDKNSFYKQTDFLKSLTTTVGRRSQIPGIVELMSKRARFLKKHPSLAVIPPTVTNAFVKRRKELSSKAVEDFQLSVSADQRPKTVKVYYRFSPKEAYQSAFLLDDGKHRDGRAGDNTFGLKVDTEGLYTEMEYYIVVENPAAISFYPSNYMFEPMKVTLEELNK